MVPLVNFIERFAAVFGHGTSVVLVAVTYVRVEAVRRMNYLKGLVVKSRLLNFLRDESGATAIEYGLITAGIAVAIIPVITGLGSHLKTTFSTISSALK